MDKHTAAETIVTCFRWYSVYSDIPPRHPRFYKNKLARNTADGTGGKPIVVLLQSISGVSASNPSVAFYDIH
jgi:hypothetical protein